MQGMIITVKYAANAVVKRKPECLLFTLSILWEKNMRKEDEFCDNLVIRTNK